MRAPGWGRVNITNTRLGVMKNLVACLVIAFTVRGFICVPPQCDQEVISTSIISSKKNRNMSSQGTGSTPPIR